MRRSEYQTEWSTPHLLSFVTDVAGENLAIHADLAGITMLIDELEGLREQLEKGDCPHSHLFAFTPHSELTNTKINSSVEEVNIVQQVKIYGWSEVWAQRHGLKPVSN